MLSRPYRYTVLVEEPGGPLKRIDGSFRPPDRVELSTSSAINASSGPPAGGIPPTVTDPHRLFAAVAAVPYATRSGSGYRFNLAADALGQLIGGAPGPGDDFTGEAFLTDGRVRSLRFDAHRGARHVRVEIEVTAFGTASSR